MNIISRFFGSSSQSKLQESKIPNKARSNGRDRVMETATIQRQMGALPDLTKEDMEGANMQRYTSWVKEQCKLIIDIRAPKGIPLHLHLKKGGIYYLDPLGIYFFPACIFRKKQGTLAPDAHGFWVDASDCEHLAAIRGLLQSRAALISGEDFYLPSSSDSVRPYRA